MIGLSFIAAFLGGSLSLLPACGPALLPVFFAYSLGRKTSLVWATVIFLAGFNLVFLPFGFGVKFITDFLIDDRSILFTIVGVLFIIFGIGLFLGWSYGINFQLSSKKIFVLGLAMGLTLSSCIAPVFGAILTLSATAQNYWQTLWYLLIFELGLALPLLILSLVFDKLNPALLFKASRYLSFISACIFLALGISFVSGYDFLILFGEKLGLIDWFIEINQKLLKP